MRWIRFIAAVYICCLFNFLPGPLQASEQQLANISSNQWIIVMHDPRSPRRKHRATGIGYSSKGVYDADPKLIRISNQLAKDYQLSIIDQWPIKSLNVHCLVATLPEGQDVKIMLKKIKNDVRVESVQAMNEFEVLGQPDPYRNMQSSLTMLAAKEIHKYVTGSGVSIAIVDSGIDTSHPDLDGVVVWQENLVDDKKNQAERHGTGIAGVIAARSNNGIGISGVAPDVKIYGLRACWQNDSNSSKAKCNTLTLSRALDRVIEKKPMILNLSLTGPDDPLLQRLLSLVIAQKTIVVSAYDEQREAINRFPRPQNGVFYGRSSIGNSADRDLNSLPAPANDILTLQPNHTYDVLTGNSLAAAHISAVIALLLEADPNLEVAELENLLHTSVVLSNNSASVNTCNALLRIDKKVIC